MKIVGTNSIIESNSLAGSTQFTIAASAKAFQVLSNTLYSHKIRAVVRELACNALDASAEAGAVEPVELKIPNTLDPNFYVKDHGSGLSDKQVRVLYTQYFASTKDGSDVGIGGLGLGSKSPFAYTDSFTVISAHEGVQRTYVAARGPQGVPVLSLLAECPVSADWTHGLTVSLPVAVKDWDEFGKEAHDFVDNSGIPEKMRLVGIPYAPRGSKRITFGFVSHDGAEIIAEVLPADAKGSPYVRMGPVCYPIDTAYAPAERAQILAKGLRLTVPIGYIGIAPSREALEYSSADKSRLAQLIQTAYEKYVEHVGDCIAKADMDGKPFLESLPYWHELQLHCDVWEVRKFLQRYTVPEHRWARVIRSLTTLSYQVPLYGGQRAELFPMVITPVADEHVRYKVRYFYPGRTGRAGSVTVAKVLNGRLEYRATPGGNQRSRRSGSILKGCLGSDEFGRLEVYWTATCKAGVVDSVRSYAASMGRFILLFEGASAESAAKRFATEALGGAECQQASVLEAKVPKPATQKTASTGVSKDSSQPKAIKVWRIASNGASSIEDAKRDAVVTELRQHRLVPYFNLDKAGSPSYRATTGELCPIHDVMQVIASFWAAFSADSDSAGLPEVVLALTAQQQKYLASSGVRLAPIGCYLSAKMLRSPLARSYGFLQYMRNLVERKTLASTGAVAAYAMALPLIETLMKANATELPAVVPYSTGVGGFQSGQVLQLPQGWSDELRLLLVKNHPGTEAALKVLDNTYARITAATAEARQSMVCALHTWLAGQNYGLFWSVDVSGDERVALDAVFAEAPPAVNDAASSLIAAVTHEMAKIGGFETCARALMLERKQTVAALGVLSPDTEDARHLIRLVLQQPERGSMRVVERLAA